MKLLLIGMDGVSWNVVDPMLEKEKLPNLARIMRQGAHGRMNNLGESRSPAIWTTLATGHLPPEHNISGFSSTFLRLGPWRGVVLDSWPWKLRRLLCGLRFAYGRPMRSYQRQRKALWNMFLGSCPGGRSVLKH